jgi:DNA polymerase-1
MGGMAGPLLATDVPWLLYRSFFALPKSITDDAGRPVNALLGTVNAILVAVEACAPRVVVACTGAESAAYRVALYPPYHAHRPPMPDELRVQWEQAPALLARMGWTVESAGELEADDLMYSHAREEAEAGGEALIVSGDRDMYAAVDEQVGILELKGKAPPTRIDAREVRRRYGIDPPLVPDFIALRGDPSDGLPGAPGIGEKTARDLLREHGSLEGVIASASRQRPRVGEALRENADLLRTFREVATLQRVEVKRPPDRATDPASGAAAARELGMNALAGRLERLAAAAERRGTE